MRIDNFALVRSGLLLARKEADPKDSTGRKYMRLNIRSLGEDGEIDRNGLTVFYSQEELKKDYLTCRGDILVRLTSPYTAVMIDRYTAGLVITSHFVLIRINSENVAPEYLYWYLCTDFVKRECLKNCLGGILGNIKPGFFKDLDIPLVSPNRQRLIANLYLEAEKIQRLAKRLLEQERLLSKIVIDEEILGKINRGIIR